MYKLSQRSLDRLDGVDERLQAVVRHAITATKTDFGVIQGMRSLEMQKELTKWVVRFAGVLRGI